MRIKRSKFKEYLTIIDKPWFYYERTNQSVDWTLFPYKIQRQKHVQEQYGKYKETGVLEYRRSFLKRYGYIQISIFYYFRINIELHRPI